MSSETRLTVSYEFENCTSTARFTQADYNYLVTFTANEGYQFIIGDSENYLEYENGTKWYPADSAYVTNDGIVNQLKMTTKMLDYPTSATMHVIAHKIESESTNVSIVQNLANCTSNFTDSTIAAGTTISITLTALDGYEFTFGLYPNFTINGVTTNFTPIDYKTCTAEIDTFGLYPNITISASATPIVIRVNQNLANCTSNFTDNSTTPNSSVNIVLYADSDYVFKSAPVYTVNGTSYNFHLNEGGKTCYTEFTAPAYGEIVVNATASIFGYNVNSNLTNCTLSPSTTLITYSDNITFTLTANQGYKFDSSNPPYYTVGNIGDRYYLSRISDYSYYVETDNVYGKKYDLNIFGKAVQDLSSEPVDNAINYGFVSIYLPTLHQLQALSKKRFFNSDMETVDAFKFVYKMHKIYFNIPAVKDSFISLGQYRTGINSLATDNAFVQANCGGVFIPELYHNVYDYQFTKTRIYLPMIGYKNLDTTNIMNCTVNLVYKANILTGNMLAVISTIERGDLYQFEGYAGFDIPYMFNEFKTGVNHDLYQSSAYLGSFIPSIHIYTNIPYGDNDKNPFGYSVSKWCKIGDCTGYIKCQDIQLVINQNYITNSEMQLIDNLLKNGVFID